MKAKNHHLRNKAAVRRAQQLYRKQMGLGLDNRPRRYGPRVKIYPSTDVVIYLDLLASRAGINLGNAIIQKFNHVSDKRGTTIKL